MPERHVSQLYTCSYKTRHNTICLMFQPQQRLARPGVAVCFNLPRQVNKSDVFPTHQTRRQHHVVHHGRLFFFFTISLLVSSDHIYEVFTRGFKLIKECHRKVCWLAFSAASHQQAGTTSNLGCSSSARSAAIFRERPLILFDVSTAENLSTKSLIDQYSSGIRAGGVGQIAHCNLLSEHFSRQERPADDLSSWSHCCWVMGCSLNGCRTINTDTCIA